MGTISNEKFRFIYNRSVLAKTIPRRIPLNSKTQGTASIGFLIHSDVLLLFHGLWALFCCRNNNRDPCYVFVQRIRLIIYLSMQRHCRIVAILFSCPYTIKFQLYRLIGASVKAFYGKNNPPVNQLYLSPFSFVRLGA